VQSLIQPPPSTPSMCKQIFRSEWGFQTFALTPGFTGDVDLNINETELWVYCVVFQGKFTPATGPFLQTSRNVAVPSNDRTKTNSFQASC
jgi:hypothetical protein